MTRRTLAKAITNREIRDHFRHHPNLVSSRQVGSHEIFTGPTGIVVTSCHPGDAKKGTKSAIERMAQLAGLAVLAVAAVAAGVLVLIA